MEKLYSLKWNDFILSLHPGKALCADCPNDHCIIKRNLGRVEMATFIERKNTLSCKKGQSFIMEGAPVHGLYFVRKGKVKVAKT